MKFQESQTKPFKSLEEALPKRDKPNGVGLSIILVTYNHRDFILPCLQSLDRISKNLDREIILVDNHSSTGPGNWSGNISANPELSRTKKTWALPGRSTKPSACPGGNSSYS